MFHLFCWVFHLDWWLYKIVVSGIIFAGLDIEYARDYYHCPLNVWKLKYFQNNNLCFEEEIQVPALSYVCVIFVLWSIVIRSQIDNYDICSQG